MYKILSYIAISSVDSFETFRIVIEKIADNKYSAYVPDLPGCIATGASRKEIERNMQEAMKLHLKGLQEDNLPVSPRKA